ncbi:hypothetical protein U9M48_000217 [Paspalum notatum var. saurae]|uniref:Isopenicillin N synthase-like Fe(2+) 2OG dioxygenase domain-containing protein n=1 Tax=Paspalum notatum var. saurae TaxID=547442 RepID=A0AAQ3SHA5_PASNO
MATAPEDLGDPEAEEPFSPSDFLNLAASPHADGDGPAAQDGDQVLPFIARMLMEEDDNNLYEYPDHTAPLQAQQTFADILSSDASTSTSTTNTFTLSPPSSSSDAFAGAAWPYDPVQLSQQLLSRTTAHHHNNKAAENGTTITMPAAAGADEEHGLQNRVSMDMLNRAFLKGLEEANKFLPTTNNGLLLDLDVSSKGKGWMFQQENTEEQGRGRSRKSRDEADNVEAEESGRSRKLIALIFSVPFFQSTLFPALEVKNAYAQRPGDLQGYGKAFVVSEDQKLDWSDSFAIRAQPPEARHLSYWPTHPHTFRKSFEDYSSELMQVTRSVVTFVAKTLHIDTKLMEDKHGAWIPVKPHPKALLVNVGDFLEIMSNGTYKSIEHRVKINATQERLSISAFHIPVFDGINSPVTHIAKDKVLYKTMMVKELAVAF